MSTINELIRIGKVKMKDLNIVGFIGVIGSGKSYQTKKLIAQGYLKIDFSDLLRESTWKILNWEPTSDKEYENFKKGRVFIPNFGYINGRKMLQALGQGMRTVDENFWTNLWKQRLDKMYRLGYNNIVVTDLRHQNELDAVKNANNANSEVIFCDYKSDRYDASSTHISEEFAQKFIKAEYEDGDII